MDERRVYGNYIVGQGKDFTVKQVKSNFGYENQLIADEWYVVHVTGKVIGCYAYTNADMAHALAMGLEQRDLKLVAEEMEKVLRGE